MYLQIISDKEQEKLKHKGILIYTCDVTFDIGSQITHNIVCSSFVYLKCLRE